MVEDRPEVVVTEGEYGGDPLTLTIYDASNTVVTLGVSDTVQLRVAKEGSSGFAVGTGSVYNAAGGIVRVALGVADVTLLTAGRYRAQVTVTGASSVTRPRWFWLTVEPAL